MSSKQFNKTITASTEPVNGLVGDSWFNPVTNKLYAYVPVNKTSPQWVEVLTTNVANNFSLTNATLTGKGTFSGSPSSLALNATNLVENVGIMNTPIVGVYNYNVTSQTVLLVTASATANFTINITGNDTTTLNNLMTVGQSISCALMVTNGGTAYYHAGLQIDGLVVAPKWQGGTAPSSGNASAVDTYMYTIIKTGNASFSAFASVTKFS